MGPQKNVAVHAFRIQRLLKTETGIGGSGEAESRGRHGEHGEHGESGRGEEGPEGSNQCGENSKTETVRRIEIKGPRQMMLSLVSADKIRKARDSDGHNYGRCF